MKLARSILAEEVGKTSEQDAYQVLHHTETWRLTVALDAMVRAFELGRADAVAEMEAAGIRLLDK